ncbi:MAG: hypothetical protein JW873_04640 [Candidatus Saganbacteria bacterium]|nr:hypothetical protein [Candidatus Saganbacteria bacterium]
MRPAKFVPALLFFWLLTLSASAPAADLNYPYGRVDLTLPPAADPFPGFGSYFSALNAGPGSSLWNPATLGKVKLTQAEFSLISPTGNNALTRTSKLDEMSGRAEIGSGTGSGGDAAAGYAIFFRPLAELSGVGTTTKEISVQSNLNYASAGGGADFSAAQRVNDWLVVGFASHGPLGGGLALAGDFPLTTRADMNLCGQNFGAFSITGAGKLNYTVSPGVTLESLGEVWSGFLSQEVNIPFTNISEFRDSLDIQAPYIGTIAARHDKFHAGLNFIPISATARIDNDVRSVVNSDAPDQYLYVPNFDPNTPEATWFTDPARYGAQAGYNGKQVVLPAGSLVSDLRYRGFYSGSAARFDLGALYDVNDWFTVGAVLENFNGATLDMRGSGLAGYATYRSLNTAETSSLLEPGSNADWNVFTDQWTTTGEVGGAPLSLEPNKVYQLPKRLRLGFALRRPFLIAVDLEQNQTPFTVPASPEITVSGLNLVRIGIESRLFSLPCWVRGGTTLALKPAVTTSDPQLADNINKAFRYGVLPVKLDFGSTIDLWGWRIGDSVGVSLLPVISLLQVDVLNTDLSKTAFFSLSLAKEAWEIKYLTQVDPAATASSYNNKTPDANGEKSFGLTDLRYTQTLGVTYKF